MMSVPVWSHVPHRRGVCSGGEGGGRLPGGSGPGEVGTHPY